MAQENCKIKQDNKYDETVIKLLTIIARAEISSMNGFRFSLQLENELYKVLDDYYMGTKNEQPRRRNN